MRVDDEDLHVGATTSLQELVDSPLAYPATAGLLPAACRSARSAVARNAATLAGESVHGDPDSEILASLLALNAVFVDGQPAASCLTLAVRAQGRSVVTIEGLGTSGKPHPIQTAFARAGAVQCGFCTPGLVLRAKALLDWVPRPTEEEVRDAISGLCRCTGYVKPVQAVLAAAEAGGR